ncbi:hypothetical protein [Paraburkholderia phenoliruptrix]|uniref:hypothetical protein n=1 Tax=Paraburkholderia phenoliruptrix TaxID=252970 RepID=UPI0034CEC292
MIEQKKPDEAAGNPGYEVGDEVYAQHRAGPCVGKIVAHGQHGATLKIGDKHHAVHWKNVLGAKKRVTQHLNVVDEGEDGMIVEGADKRRRFVAVPPEAREDRMVVKALGGHRLVTFAKAQQPPEDESRDAPFKVGDRVSFEAGEFSGVGVVVGEPGRDGAYVRDDSGRLHQVRWAEMKGVEADPS